MSAFNVILGKMFSDVTVYTTTERVFGVPKIVIPQTLDYKHMNVNQNTTTNYTERTRLNQIP
jgi:hypothetical protein